MKLLTFNEACELILSGIAVIILEIATKERLTDEATIDDLRALLAEGRKNEVRLYSNV